MVFTSMALFIRTKRPESFWKKRKVFRMAAHFQSRNRNVWALSLKLVKRALVNATTGRALRKKDMKSLWETRITAGVEEHGFTFPLLKTGLNISNVFLNSKVLADLSIWEPRTFKALTHLAWASAARNEVEGAEKVGPPPPIVGIRNLKDS